MPTIDDKVVAASFESGKFESGVSKTISALEKLKAALHFPTAGQGLENISKAAGKVDLSHISKGIEDISGKLSALRLTAIAVFAQLAQHAAAAGAQVVKSLTIGPLIAGFKEYSTNLNAVQTILANTEASGATLTDVNDALLKLNQYSDKTIYNFSQMARNIGTFTAAGVDLDTSVQSIKGIANLAALSGSNAEQASTAMYQLSQAISAGRVGLQDWNSVVNAGMGGTVFQRALAQTAVAMGEIPKSALKLEGPMKNVSIHGESFRQSMQAKPGQQSWLTSKVLTTTLKQFTGDLTDAELKAQGFTDAQIMAIQQTAKTAQHAATEVKTIAQVFDVAKETAGSGWAQTFQIIFGNFGEAKKTFTDLSNAINGFINKNAEARNKVLGDWKKLGGRTILIDSISTAFHNLGLILAPIKAAFRDIFPATTGRDLLELTKRFQSFAEALRPSAETVFYLRRTFRGLFAALDIGWEIIKGVVGVFKDLIGATGAGGGGFLLFTAKIGNALVKLHEWLIEGGKLNDFFDNLSDILKVPVMLFGKLKDILSDLFDGFSAGGVSDQISGMTKAMTPFERILDAVVNLWDKLADSLSNVDFDGGEVLTKIVEFVQDVGPAIGKAVANINFELVLDAIRTGLLLGLVVMFKSFLGRGSLIQQIGGQGLLSKLTLGLTGKGGLFGALTSSMTTMQNNVKADTLRKIAISIALLAASVVALSFVDPERLKSSLTAITVMFGQLLGAMAILDKVGKSGGFIKMPFITASLIALAIAIDLLAIAVIALSRLSWEELKKGLGAVAFLLGVISVAVIPLSANSGGMIRAGIGITAIAVAMKILASAVKDFGAMDLPSLAKGLGAVAASLGIIVAVMQKMPPKAKMISVGVGLIAVGVALKLIASAIKDIGQLKIDTIGKGLFGIGGALILIGKAMELMPKNMVFIGAGLLLVSLALQGIAKAVKNMGEMSMKQIAKGLIGLAGALVILAGALYLMKGTFGASIALAAVSASLGIMVPMLILLGKQSWTTIIKGLVGLAGAFAIIGVTGALLAPVAPAMLAFGAALVVVGAGLALAGAGIFLIGAGLSAIAVAGTASIGILVAALIELSKAIPEIASNVVKGFLAIAEGIVKSAPEFVKALAKILELLLDTIIKVMPKIVKAFQAILDGVLKLLHDNQAKLIQSGFDLLIALLDGIKNNIGRIVPLVVDIITKFLTSIANNIGRIVTAGASILIALLRGISDNIFRVISTAVEIVTKFLVGLGDNMKKIVVAGATMIVKILEGLASGVSKMFIAAGDLIVVFIQGLGQFAGRVVRAGVDTVIKFLEGVAKDTIRFINATAQVILHFLDALDKAIVKYEPQIIDAGVKIGVDILKGMAIGLASSPAKLAKSAFNAGKNAIKNVAKGAGSKSPSVLSYAIGQDIVEGLALGMADHKKVMTSGEAMGTSVISAVKRIFKITSPSQVMIDIGEFVGQGFAEGLRGSLPDIVNAASEITTAFTDLNAKLKAGISSTTADIISKNKQLTELQSRKQTKETSADIALLTKEIYGQYTALSRLTAAQKLLNGELKDERTHLSALSIQYEKKGKQIEAATTLLDNRIQTRKDAVKSFTDQYSTLPSIVTEDAEGNAVDQLATYLGALKHQADAVAAYQSTLDQLRKLGLDDATYQKLLAEGTADQQFATQLLAGGRTAVQSLNTLDSQLMTVSKTLAVNSANNLYQAGINAAQGLVNGLESQRSAIRRKMEAIARDIINTLNRALKARSPSQEMAKIGGYAMEGLALGLTNSSKIVTTAVDAAGKGAISAMQQTMRDISDVVTGELNPDPVITPVLDLTQIRRQAGELGAITDIPLTTTASLAQAAAISAQQTATQAEQLQPASGVNSITFQQTNNSPEALSEIEIYRQTRNQLSQLKTVLAPV